MRLMFLLLLFFSSPSFAVTAPDAYLKRFLKVFKDNPSAAMKFLPPKYDAKGNPVRSGQNIPIEAKDRSRQTLCNGAQPGESCQPPRFYPTENISGSNDLRNFFLSQKIETRLEPSSQQVSFALAIRPWSGDYWPTYKGGIVARYTNQAFPTSRNFEDYSKYLKNNWSVDLTDQKQIDQLSPAEKYDILMGLSARPLAQAILGEASETYRSNNNSIEAWFGICHGWAAAAYMMARPQHTIEVESLLPNVKVHFYPDDIKALASHLWATTPSSSRVMGGRCNDKNPKRDENGRVISEDCYDINPGSWHLAVFNQLAVRKKSFVIDATYDYEVWNQPVVGYKISFFNPETNDTSEEVSRSLIPLSGYRRDPFKKYRGAQSTFVVGVSMELTYIAEIRAMGNLVSGEADDHLSSVQYVYDLEVDRLGNIVGGEWYQNGHPDFIWTPQDGSRALSYFERELSGSWHDSKAPPSSWTATAEKAGKYSQPLGSVIENLVELSH